MDGSDHSGEEIAAGRTNRAEHSTKIWAQRSDESESNVDFNGTAILTIEVAPNVEDPDDFEGGNWEPGHPLDGIVASGSSGAILAVGGIEVVGNGGHIDGTGVLGRGAGASPQGIGGIGVRGIGGPQRASSSDPTVAPGIGVLGQGGRQDPTSPLRLPHGAGVVGVAGGAGRPAPTPAQTGSVGVFGQGADAEEDTSTGTTLGPPAPGAGVLGRGGVPIPRRSPIAAGVIGLAGDTAIPPITETGDAGVFGKGPKGVQGIGTDQGVRGLGTFGVMGIADETRGPGVGVQGSASGGVGVRGLSGTDRGGVFGGGAAQVQLIPTRLVFDDRGPGTPALPKAGQGGDLIAIEDGRGQCTLWFCVKGVQPPPPTQLSPIPARWAQVLLGSEFDGRA